MELERVIFAIDNGHDIHQQAKFLRLVDTLRAMNKLKGSVVSCIGMYHGTLERSYMMLSVDYETHIAHTSFVQAQESVLYVPGDTRQPCTLRYSSGSTEALGTMSKIDYGEAVERDSWTYIEETGKYYAC